MPIDMSNLSNWKKALIGAGAVGVLIIALGVIKFIKISNAIAQNARFSPPPEAVTSYIVKSAKWQRSLRSVGTLIPSQGVTLSAEEPGKVVRIAFESGQDVEAGDLLVELDTALEEAKFRGAEATVVRAREDLERARSLRSKSLASQADLDRAQAEADEAEASLEWFRATIQRKKIRAPFAGRTGIRMVNVGDYLNAGDEVVPLHDLDPLFVNFTITQGDVGKIAVGQELRLFIEGQELEAKGVIHAINPQIDEKTRTIQVQGMVPNTDEKLRPGMFARVEVVLPNAETVLSIPVSSIQYAPYGDMVYVIEELSDPAGQKYRGVRQQVVKLGDKRGDQIIVESGITEGMTIVSSGVFKLRPGAAISEHNELAPENDPAPKPSDS